VNNREFSAAVIEYVNSVRDAESKGQEPPVLPNYIAECFLKIAEGLSHKSNFARYTYREEMVMDAVENCLKAVTNFKTENYPTREGGKSATPNAFAYFTQISYYAFLRRLAKEKRQQDVRMKFIEESGIEDFMESGGDVQIDSDNRMFVDNLRDRIDKVHVRDQVLKEFNEEEKRRKLEEEDDDGSDPEDFDESIDVSSSFDDDDDDDTPETRNASRGGGPGLEMFMG
jgi:hypothetical protein